MSNNSNPNNNHLPKREFLSELDEDSYRNVYRDFIQNPLFKVFIDFIEEQVVVQDTAIMSAPPVDATSGWFALREQAIGAKFSLSETVKTFLLNDIKPEPQTQE